MAADFKFDVFLSHSSRDKAVVRGLAERLRGDGLRVWLDEWEIRPGDSIPAKIEAGLEHSRGRCRCGTATRARGRPWRRPVLRRGGGSRPGAPGLMSVSAAARSAAGDSHGYTVSSFILPPSSFILPNSRAR